MGMCNVDQILEFNCNTFLVGSIAECKFCPGNLLNRIVEI